MSLADFERKATAAITELRKTGTREILLVHHDDADGLSSGALTKAALEGEGFATKMFCLEKVYPEVTEDLHKGKGKVIFYCDIGSGHADFISNSNSSRNLTIILDHHHNAPKVADPKIYDLNLEHFGFEGDTDFSSSTCCYLFAKTLSKRNADLSYLALVGSREIPGDYSGLNKAVLEEAKKAGAVKSEEKKLMITKLNTTVDALFSQLQILGAVGYFEGGPQMGVEACLTGITADVKKKAQELEEKRKSVNKRVLGRLYRKRLNETEHLQWFDAGDLYRGMGTKVIGQLCSYLSYQKRLVKPDKYILGFMNVPLEVPGWQGRLNGPLVKVSVRVPKGLHDLIDKGKMPGTVDLLQKASEGFGIADGHKYAANVVIHAGKKDLLLKNAETSAKG